MFEMHDSRELADKCSLAISGRLMHHLLTIRYAAFQQSTVSNMNIPTRPFAMTRFFGKPTLAVLLLLSTFTTSSALALEDDEKKHLAASTAISATLNATTNRPWISLGSCLAVGAAKELYDGRQSDNHFDWQDMQYNALGCAIGIPIGKGARWLFTDGRSLGFRARF